MCVCVCVGVNKSDFFKKPSCMLMELCESFRGDDEDEAAFVDTESNALSWCSCSLTRVSKHVRQRRKSSHSRQT